MFTHLGILNRFFEFLYIKTNGNLDEVGRMFFFVKNCVKR